MLAAQEGHTDVALALLKAGADPNSAARGGQTPLMLASMKGRTVVVSALLAGGAQSRCALVDGSDRC